MEKHANYSAVCLLTTEKSITNASYRFIEVYNNHRKSTDDDDDDDDDDDEYTILEIQFRSVNYTLVARICKNFEQNKPF